MSSHAKVAGVWKAGAYSVKVGGAWKAVAAVFVRVGGAWKTVAAAASACSFSGALSASGTGSTTVTGTARTITVPAGNSGVVRFISVDESVGDLEYKHNAGAFTGISEGTEITLANGDTLQTRGTSLAIEESVSATLIDVTTGATIQSVVMSRGGA